jgi:hypothetical protein
MVCSAMEMILAAEAYNYADDRSKSMIATSTKQVINRGAL